MNFGREIIAIIIGVDVHSDQIKFSWLACDSSVFQSHKSIMTILGDYIEAVIKINVRKLIVNMFIHHLVDRVKVFRSLSSFHSQNLMG